MLMTASYSPEPEYASATFPILSRPDAAIAGRRIEGGPDTETLGELVLEALGASAWQASHQTFGYRWRGTDTLDSGSLETWIQIKLVRCLIETLQRGVCLVEYDALREFIVESSHLRQLGELYLLRNATAARRFLRAYPRLFEVLFEAHSHLQKHFGPEIRAALEVVSDPEATDREQLFAYIPTSLPVDEALAQLDGLDEEWFLNQLDRVDGLLNFNLEFA